jgi:flavin-dependent dehydrogenase
MLRVVIIGAGPAGCTAAIILARSGIDVTLIEQHRFPRDKVCGECLSALGIDVLGRLRISPAVESLTPVALRRTIFFSPDGARSEFTLPRPMWGISRSQLDNALLGVARESGARVLQPARCETVGPPVTVRCLHTNRIDQLDADFVLLADGKSTSTGDFGLKGHFADVDAPRDAIELFGVRGHYGGVAPIEGSRWNIAFSVPGRRIKQWRGKLEEMFAQIVAENLVLARQLRGARRISDWLVSPLPRSAVQRRWPKRVIPIGNAAASIEPIGGEGMGLAMRSAELAAAAILGRSDPSRLAEQYRHLWRARRFACRSAALLVGSPILAAMIAGHIRQDTPLTASVLRLVGKTSAREEAPAPRLVRLGQSCHVQIESGSSAP